MICLWKMDILRQFTFGSCAQHTVHGGLQTRVANTGWDIGKILKAMYYILHDSPAKWEIYAREGETAIYPLR